VGGVADPRCAKLELEAPLERGAVGWLEGAAQRGRGARAPDPHVRAERRIEIERQEASVDKRDYGRERSRVVGDCGDKFAETARTGTGDLDEHLRSWTDEKVVVRAHARGAVFRW
jgi:hypothetical protein